MEINKTLETVGQRTNSELDTVQDRPERCRFLDLPAEIRVIIYRYLLTGRIHVPSTEDFSLNTITRPPDLYPVILRTCRRILFEAQPILYGENTFGIFIYPYFALDTYLYVAGDLPFPQYSRNLSKWVRRLDIQIQLSDGERSNTFKDCLRSVCVFLSELPRLDHIHIKLDYDIVSASDSEDETGSETGGQTGGETGSETGDESDIRTLSIALQGFTLLRNLQSVTFENVLPVHAKVLKGLMTGNSPLDHLPKMHKALRAYLRCYSNLSRRTRKYLQEARYAMQGYNVKKFKKLRAKILVMIDGHVAHHKSHLFDYDAKEYNARDSVGNPASSV